MHDYVVGSKRQCGVDTAFGVSSRPRSGSVRLHGIIPGPGRDASWLRQLPSGASVKRDVDIDVTAVERTNGAFRIEASIVDAKFSDTQSGRLLATSTPVAPKAEMEPAAPFPAKEPAFVVPAKGGPDILGIQIGMAFAEAEKIIRANMDVGLTLVADRKWQPSAAVGNIYAYTSGRLFLSRDRKQAIIIYDEPPAATAIVMGVARQVQVPERHRSRQRSLCAAQEKIRKRSFYRPRHDWGTDAGVG